MSGSHRIAAPAKINLVLDLLGRRDDGFHELRTVLQTIDLRDELEIEPADDLALVCDAEGVPRGEDNLVLRAARALAAAAGRAPRARIRLEKAIPPSSGLGGGSSDAAAALLGLAHLWGLPPETDLAAVAAGIGSDVPFFLRGGTGIGLGRGEVVLPLPDVPPAWVVVARPERGLATREVYEAHAGRLTTGADVSSMRRFARHLLRGDRDYGFVRNDLEPSASALLPQVGTLIAALREAGALASTVSGSGSAVFGVFADEASARAARQGVQGEESVRTWLCRTLGAGTCHRVRLPSRGDWNGDH